MVGNMKCLWILVGLLGTAVGYSRFRRDIPNGYKVPHPCQPGAIWDAVGHAEPYHVVSKNAFGQMVMQSPGHPNLNWTAICKADADGDGYTNGQELGDPNCIWTKDRPTPLQEPMGHPGICEPSREMCSSGSTYVQCPNRKAGPGAGMNQQARDFRTPPPHAGKHPQALLTERLGAFGGRNNFGFQQSGFGGQSGPSSARGGFGGQQQSFGPPQQPPSFGPDTFGASGGFGMQGQSMDWSTQMAGGQQRPPTGGLNGGFGGSSQNAWMGNQRSQSGADASTIARTLDQRFLHDTTPEFNDMPFSSGGQPSQPFGQQQAFGVQQSFGTQQPFDTQQSFGTQQPFGSQQSFGSQQAPWPQQSPSGQGMLQQQVQRRIQQARDSSLGGGPIARGGVRWQGAQMGGARSPVMPPFFGGSGSMGRRFMF